jgi:LPS-assembly protein
MRLRLCLALLFTLAAFLPVTAQDIASLATLKADRITYTTGYRVLRATGNVEITLGQTRLTARELVYDERNDRITAIGPIRLTDGDNITIVAEFAELSGDLQNGVLKSARMVLNQQLQIAAVEISRSEGRFNQLFKAAASSCIISKARPTPLWQIRARRIIQDEVEQQLYFEGAQLRVLGVPVAYVPRLRVPSPEVKRATGFLVPGITNSDTLGAGVSAPYFIRLGDYADATLTPNLYSSGSATLEARLRKNFANGRLELNGAVARDTVNANGRRAYLFANGDWRLRNGLQAALNLELVSDRSFLQEFGLSGKQRLESRLALSRFTRKTRFNAEIEGFRSLATGVSDATIPTLLGEVSLYRRWLPAGGSQIGLGLTASSFARRSNADVIGRDGVKLAAIADWRREWIGRNGVIFSTTAALNSNYYNISQDSGFPTPFLRTTPVLAADIRLPMIRARAQATEVIEPRLQIAWSNPSGTSPPDDDSQLVEFAASNLFSLNRFTGDDRQERGLRANIGLTYSRNSTSGWTLEAQIGKVVRLGDPGQFTVPSGLSGSASSYVLAAQLALPRKFRLVQRMVFAPGSGISRNETSLAWKSNRFDLASRYLWLLKDAGGNTVSDRSEWTLETGWDFARNWRSQASMRYDLMTGAASDAALALTYRNECIKVDFSLSRRYAASSNVGPSTSFGLMVTLEGLGGRAGNPDSDKKCSHI